MLQKLDPGGKVNVLSGFNEKFDPQYGNFKSVTMK